MDLQLGYTKKDCKNERRCVIFLASANFASALSTQISEVAGALSFGSYVKGRIRMAREKSDSANVKKAAAEKKPVEKEIPAAVSPASTAKEAAPAPEKTAAAKKKTAPAAKEAEPAPKAAPAAKEAEPVKKAAPAAKEAEPAKKTAPAAKEAEPAKKAAPAAKEAEPAKKAAPTTKKAEPAKKTASAAKKAEPAKKTASTKKKAASADKRKAKAPVVEPESTPAVAETAPVMEEPNLPRRSVAFIGSECHPFVKTGGLGDVMYALPRELARLNCDVRVILPRYACIPQE